MIPRGHRRPRRMEDVIDGHAPTFSRLVLAMDRLADIGSSRDQRGRWSRTVSKLVVRMNGIT